MIFENRPDLIIETGTYRGGSALFLASICDLVGKGRVITVDINRPLPGYPDHERITYYGGASSTDEAVVAQMQRHASEADEVMVILDSDHQRDHVLAELDVYAPLVTEGQYLIVEDTSANGHPIMPDYGPGPLEAIRKWTPNHPEFQWDEKRNSKFLMTFHPEGFYRRISSS